MSSASVLVISGFVCFPDEGISVETYFFVCLFVMSFLYYVLLVITFS